MNIRLLKQGWMTTSGSSLLRMMQNVNTPALDLIVRESLQNSLDASLPNVDKIPVKFIYNDFDVDRLSKEFDGIGEKLKSIQFENGYKFLSITDTNTKGLTGHLNGIFNSDEINQNLGKLVFQIMKPQSDEGAGGSWGIGKTVYYRLGVGLVIYYSRIKLDDGSFQNRLVAALVEDEKKEGGMLADYGKDNLGAAFFGEEFIDNYNNLRAITDNKYIENFLDIFGLKPFDGDKTGTSIIIPFIDENSILSNNVSDEEEQLWWSQSIEEYLKVSILRWYYPRVSKGYVYAARLEASINGNPVIFDSDIPFFSKMRELYDAAFKTEYSSWIKKTEITRFKNVKENVIGWFMYGKVPASELGSLNHLPSPYKHIGNEELDSSYNTPIVAFCRKPGMIINYKSDWNVKTTKDEYILGMFVLNSKNDITSPVTINLDEYLRKGEKSDHAIWVDYSIKNGVKQVNIVGSIYYQIRSRLELEYTENKVVSGQGELNTILANKFGKKFLPDENFGDTPSKARGKGSRGGSGQIHKSKNYTVSFEQRYFKKDSIALEYRIELKGEIKKIEIYSVINTISNACKVSTWEETGIQYPLNIEKIALRCIKYGDKSVDDTPVFVKDSGDYKYFKYEILKSKMNKNYGIKFEKKDEFVPMEFILRIAFSTVDRTLQANFEFDFEEE